MKRYRVIAALLAALLLLPACNAKPDASQSQEPAMEPGEVTISYESDLSEHRADENDPDSPVIFRYNNTIPTVSIQGGEDQAAAINAALRADAEAFKNGGGDEGRVSSAEVLEMARDRYENNPEFFTVFGGNYDMERIMREVRDTGQTLTLVYEDYYFLGGVHPSTRIMSRNFDVTRGEPLTLDGLSPQPEKFREFLEQSVLDQIHSGEVAEEGFFEDYEEKVSELLENQQWYFDENGLTVFANAEDLGPYAMGMLFFPIEYTQIAEMIHEKYLPTV